MTDVPRVRVRRVLTRVVRRVQAHDAIVTAFRDGQVTLRSLRREEGFTNADKEIGYQGVEPGDLVVHAMDAFAGAIGVSDSRGKASPVVHVYRAPRGDERFVAYLLRSYAWAGLITAHAKGVRERSTSFDAATLAQLELPWPEQEAQRRIANFLDDQVARHDAILHATLDQRLALPEHYDAAALELFSSCSTGLIAVRRLLIGPAQYGLVPTEVLEDTLCPRYIRTTDIREDGQLREDTFKAVPEREGKDYLLKSGDILVSRAGSIGRCLVYDADMGPAVFAGYLVRLRLFDYEPHLFRLFLRSSAFRAQVEAGAVQSTIENFNAERYKDVLLPDVPRHRQLDLLRELLHVERAMSSATEQWATLASVIEERKRALITACVNGEFDVSTASARAGDVTLAGVRV
jgi:type I restriction enzyme S subunit